MNGARPRSLESITALLSHTLGDATARRVVWRHARALKLPEELTQEEALRLLERIAKEDGIVGITARFAKTRIHLSG
ncbi:MAG: hypothetical protein AAGE52_22250 [Myxococcota bacterium]